MTMDESYFNWLCKVSSVSDNPYKSYRLLAKKLYFTDFLVLEPMDENRASDGIDLRKEYERDTGLRIDLYSPCSILEMMVALASRMNYITLDEEGTDRTGFFFYIMLENLGLTDRFYDECMYDEELLSELDDILEVLNRRLYEYDGRGGLFPLASPPCDQRKADVWYQMQYWICENLLR